MAVERGLQAADLLSSLGPGTTGCSTLGKSCWWPALWIPSAARHRGLAGGPDGCFWSESWRTDGWADVVAGMHCPPHPQQCRWPGSCPADSASVGQSLPGPHLGPVNVVSLRKPQKTCQTVRIGSVADSPASASAKGRLLCHCSLGRGGSRRSQTIEDWCPWRSLLRWYRFPAGLGITVSLGERDWWPSHPVHLSDGSQGVLKDLGLWIQNTWTLERCRPRGGKDLRLEPEVLQQGVTAQQLKTGSDGCAELEPPDTVLGQQQLLSRTQSVGPVTTAGSAKADESAGPVTCRPVICWAVICWAVTCQVVTCQAVTCWAVICWSGRQRDHCDGSLLSLLWCDRRQLDLTSGHVWQPRHQAVHTLTSVMKLGSGPDPRSADDLEWWRRVSMSGSRAEPSQRHGPGLLPTPSMSWRVTGPWWVLKSLRPVNRVCPKHHCVIYGVQIRWSRKALGRRPPWIFPPQRRWMKGSSSCHWIWKTGRQSLPP